MDRCYLKQKTFFYSCTESIPIHRQHTVCNRYCLKQIMPVKLLSCSTMPLHLCPVTLGLCNLISALQAGWLVGFTSDGARGRQGLFLPVSQFASSQFSSPQKQLAILAAAEPNLQFFQHLGESVSSLPFRDTRSQLDPFPQRSAP